MPPLRYHWGPDPVAGRPRIDCDLECRRCAAQTHGGAQCSRTTCMYLPYCHQHTKSLMHLQVRPSGVPGAGLGLFATGNNAAAVRFPAGTPIAPLEGLKRTQPQIDALYGDGDELAPYATSVYLAPDVPGRVNHNLIIHDAACARSVGSYANTVMKRRRPHITDVASTNAHILNYNRNMLWHMTPDPRPWLVATKNIHQGEEILVSYGPVYLAPGQSFATLPRHCTVRKANC